MVITQRPQPAGIASSPRQCSTSPILPAGAAGPDTRTAHTAPDTRIGTATLTRAVARAALDQPAATKTTCGLARPSSSRIRASSEVPDRIQDGIGSRTAPPAAKDLPNPEVRGLDVAGQPNREGHPGGVRRPRSAPRQPSRPTLRETACAPPWPAPVRRTRPQRRHRERPTRVRRSEIRCPPTPSAAPRSRASARTYVPLEHSTSTSTSSTPSPGRGDPTTSNRLTVTGRAASSTASPERTRS